ncbi:neuromedin-U isoform 5-T5 [Anomaloglossus baeobatrachus]|uniref:neuromedin-U isoform X5 n=1 Tax=Anomaloglossus baeobatrachus TaxID=238106 RepID=UPI003F506A3D
MTRTLRAPLGCTIKAHSFQSSAGEHKNRRWDHRLHCVLSRVSAGCAMLSPSSCKRQPAMQKASEDTTQNRCHQHSTRGHTTSGLLLLIVLISWTSICEGAPFSSPVFRAEEELQLWNGIDDACSAVLSDSQPGVSSALEELCFMVMGILQKSTGLEEKDDSKRHFNFFSAQFLFHYSKSHDSGNSDITEEVQGPGGVLSRGYFLFRPRNGRRSAGFR